MAFKKGEGGRPKGSKNKLTLARLQLRQEALRRLNEDLPTYRRNQCLVWSG